MRSAPAIFSAASTLRQAREVAPIRAEGVLAEARGTQTLDGVGEFERINVKADQQAARLNAFQDRARVPAEAERAVDRDRPRFGGEHGQHFLDHDRAMHPCRCLAGVDDFPDVGFVPGGVQLFVLLVKPARVLAGVTRTPPPCGRRFI